MQTTEAVAWGVLDFAVMGILIFVTGSLFVPICRRMSGGKKYLAGGMVLLTFLFIWAELAVGVFTRLGS